jgi:hypothetical protein
MTVGAANDGETDVPLLVKVKDFCLLRSIQTGCEAHSASFSGSIEGAFPGIKTAGSVKVTTYFNVFLNLRMSEFHPLKTNGRLFYLKAQFVL